MNKFNLLALSFILAAGFGQSEVSAQKTFILEEKEDGFWLKNYKRGKTVGKTALFALVTCLVTRKALLSYLQSQNYFNATVAYDQLAINAAANAARAGAAARAAAGAGAGAEAEAGAAARAAAAAGAGAEAEAEAEKAYIAQSLYKLMFDAAYYPALIGDFLVRGIKAVRGGKTICNAADTSADFLIDNTIAGCEFVRANGAAASAKAAANAAWATPDKVKDGWKRLKLMAQGLKDGWDADADTDVDVDVDVDEAY